MEFNLCYKTYPFKIDLAACRKFYEQTNLDLQYVLLKYIEAVGNTREMSLFERTSYMQSIFSFEVASYALFFLAKSECTGVSIQDIQDGMFRVSWVPNERNDEMSEPWPLVMAEVALKVNEYFSNNLPKKKAPDTEE